MAVKELCVVLLLVGFTSAQSTGSVNNGPPSSRTRSASSTISATNSGPAAKANSQTLSPEDMHRLKLFLASLPGFTTSPISQQPVVASGTNRHHQQAATQETLLPVAHVQRPSSIPAKPTNTVQEPQQITQKQKPKQSSQQQSQPQQPPAPPQRLQHPTAQQQQQQQLLPSTQHQLQVQPQLQQHQRLPIQTAAQHQYHNNLQGMTGFQSNAFNNQNYGPELYVNNHISALENLHLGYSFGLSEEQKFRVLENHNHYRSDITFTSNMNVLRWNETLAERAAAEINSCLYFNKGNGAIYAMIYEKYTGTSLISEAVGRWADEKNKFRLSVPCTDVKACRYSQIVWAETREVGCARQTCNDMSMVACMYDPPGNVIGEQAYKPGRACSRCAPGSRCNTDNLCEW